MDFAPARPYFSGLKPEAAGPLTRYLPPVPEGVAQAFLAERATPGLWVLEPFGASPRFAVELARAGARVITTAGNPINRFLLNLAAQPPSRADLQAALADLAAARKADERLETHIQSLYLTRCAQCGRELPAEAFLWDSHSGALTGRVYNCACGSGGEQPATDDDLARASAWTGTDNLYRSRVLGRLAPTDDPDRSTAQEALDFYKPRAVYALGTLVNRLDALQTSDERRRCMLALLLWAFDAVNALWPHPAERPRPRQLSFPGLFRENNVWLALEAAVQALGNESNPPIAHTLWPEEPPENGGLCLYEGPLRALAPELKDVPLQAIAGVLPRPNQAFWTLSALWVGWLWGREAVGPFKSVLRRRRYDWNWHTEALRALFDNLAENTSGALPFFGLLTEPEPGFVSAALLAARLAGFDLGGLALRGEQEPLQIHWRKADKKRPARLPLDVHFTRKVLHDILEAYSEPLPYLHLHTLALAAFMDKGMTPSENETLTAYDTVLHAALQSPEFIDLENRATPETGAWALKAWGRQDMFDQMRQS